MEEEREERGEGGRRLVTGREELVAREGQEMELRLRG